MSRNSVITAGVFLASLAILAPAASAHELRAVGPNGEYTLVVGWFIEPAFTGVVNAFDVRINRSSDKKAINASKGDVVDLEVEVQYRAGEDEKAAVIESVMLPNKVAITFGTDNRYASWFKPVRSGAYAFRVKGKISDASDPKAGALTIDEVFVCGKGARGGGHHGGAFVCLEEPLVFPAEAKPAPVKK